MKGLSKLSTSIFMAVVLIPIGIAFIFADHLILSNIYFTTIGIIIVILGIGKIALASSDTMTKIEFRLDVIEGIVNLIVGIIFINFWEYFFIDCIIFAFYIATPIARFFFRKRVLDQFLIDVLKYYFAITILCSTRYTSEYYFPIIGFIHIVFALIILIRKIFLFLKKKGAVKNEIKNN